MKKCYLIFWFIVIVILSAGVISYVVVNRRPVIERYNTVNQTVNIRPDYTSLMIPPNIAPLNFMVQKPGRHYFVKIYSKEGEPIVVHSRNQKIIIPLKAWHGLLEANKGSELFFDIFVKNQNGQWDKYNSIINKIAPEPIDEYLVYRRIHPVHSGWGKMGIYQRNLTDYDESEVLSNDKFSNGCVNCHSFANNRTDKMLLDIRSQKFGSNTILIQDGKIDKFGTKFGYISWHPSGKMAVYSINKVRQFYHTAGSEVRDVIDLSSLLAYFHVDSKTVKIPPKMSQKDRMETYPTWSPDGKYLYFCSAPVRWKELDKVPPDEYERNQYDLMRISYDIEQDKWGELETVLLAKDTGKCMLLPRVSPDGRWLICCMCDYGSFPVYRASSDLYLIDLEEAQKTGKFEYRRLDINSEHSESWHSFSSNSRWLVFSSKRRSGEFTRTYFSYIDAAGKMYKPVLMPQKDPEFYDYFLMTFSVPELVISPVNISPKSIAKAIRSEKATSIEMPKTMASPKAGDDSPWQQAERE